MRKKLRLEINKDSCTNVGLFFSLFIENNKYTFQYQKWKMWTISQLHYLISVKKISLTYQCYRGVLKLWWEMHSNAKERPFIFFIFFKCFCDRLCLWERKCMTVFGCSFVCEMQVRALLNNSLCRLFDQPPLAITRYANLHLR